jgi:hypothetical protein
MLLAVSLTVLFWPFARIAAAMSEHTNWGGEEQVVIPPGRTCYTHEQVVAWCSDAVGVAKSVMGVPGWHFWRVRCDAMHLLDLGIVPYAMASLLWEVTSPADGEGLFPGTTRQCRLDAAHVAYTRWVQSEGLSSKAAKWYVQSLRRGREFPHITQQNMKAHEARHIVYWAESVLSTQLHSAGAYQVVRYGIFAGLVAMDLSMREEGRYMRPQALQELQAGAQLFLESYIACAANAMADGRLLHKLIPKLHQVVHMVYDHAPQANPRIRTCMRMRTLPARQNSCVATLPWVGRLMGTRQNQPT